MESNGKYALFVNTVKHDGVLLYNSG